MKVLKIVLGLVLIVVGIWAFIWLENQILQYVIGIIATIAGIVLLVFAFKGGEALPVEGKPGLPAKKEVVPAAKV
jgi:uncharacterized membrane protein HdeD (DUF308 family)